MDIVIASLTRPTNVQAFFEAIKNGALEGPCTISAGVFTGGKGCGNYGFRINGADKDAEDLANAITMALMPAKWSQSPNDPMLKEGEFYSTEG